ncbi:MAG: Rrf2 family transcriptional regulator [Cyanobacteria bacterium M_surface_7_m2_040]|nr:Rrf2 family transcriptional regulator [Cyanobacteria bacterium M_surface_9_m1_291]MBM5827990.1 Rrf2 family transcriptional regulator [Cyanobacteria bacterium M_surface_7_m2_040]
MAFSAKTEYGLVALIELAAAHGSGELLQTGEICRRHGIPERYLEQMLTALRKGGFLLSIRGPRGGFQLAQDPATITVAAVEACLEGDSRLERKGRRESAEFQVLRRLSDEVETARKGVLTSLTLAVLQQECETLRSPQPMFYI